MTDAPLSEDEQRAFVEGVLDLAREGRTEPLLEMINAGVSVDLANARGDTALILAAYREHPQTVDALLAAGADTGIINNMGQTALIAAVFRNSEPIVRALLHAGADPDIGAHTAHEVAQQFGLPEMQRILTEHATTPRD
ncbi:ankyrin repeat domain-containing protein [Homoserinimonas sp. A520]